MTDRYIVVDEAVYQDMCERAAVAEAEAIVREAELRWLSLDPEKEQT